MTLFSNVRVFVRKINLWHGKNEDMRDLKLRNLPRILQGNDYYGKVHTAQQMNRNKMKHESTMELEVGSSSDMSLKKERKGAKKVPDS